MAKEPQHREWVQRHNLLAAREGGSLPDLTLYRDGPAVVARWFPDPDESDAIRPVRFFTQGERRLSPENAEQLFQRLVEEVVARLDCASDGDVVRLRENWHALCASRQEEPELCAWGAQLGVDAYDSSVLTDELITIFESKVRVLGEDLRADLLEASSASTLAADLDWLTMALQTAHIEQAPGPSSALETPSSAIPPPFAHEFGYQQAD